MRQMLKKDPETGKFINPEAAAEARKNDYGRIDLERGCYGSYLRQVYTWR